MLGFMWQKHMHAFLQSVTIAQWYAFHISDQDDEDLENGAKCVCVLALARGVCQ